MRTGITITVTPADRRRLEAITRDRNATQKHARRAAIVLLSADGVGTNEVMRRTGKSKTCIWRWQERFMQEGVDGLLRLMLPGETARRWFCLLRLDGIAPRNRISCCAPSEAVLILVRGSHELIGSRGLGQKGSSTVKHFRILGASALMALSMSAYALAADEKLNIGIVTFSSSDVDTNQMIDTMTQEAEGKGWSVEKLNANGDPSQAITAIKQLVTKQVDAIIVTVFDSTGLAAGLTAAAEAHIPVLSAGGGMAEGIALSASTGAAQPLLDLMVSDLGGTGTVLALTYHPGIPCRERADGFDAVVAANPGLNASTFEISIPGAAESSQAATSAWLAKNANAKGPFAIFNCYDDNAMGAIAALKQNNRTDVKVYSYNATLPAVQAVKDGSMRATLGVDLTSAGKMLVDQIPDILAAGEAWEPKSFVPGYNMVTAENVDQFMADNPQ